MIKGCQKKIIFIQGSENSPFETAYFVLKKDSEDCCHGGDDIIKEANRIISESLPDVKRKNKKRAKLKQMLYRIMLFGIGLLLGGGAGAGIILLLVF